MADLTFAQSRWGWKVGENIQIYHLKCRRSEQCNGNLRVIKSPPQIIPQELRLSLVTQS